MKKEHFNIVMLIARPGAGKSEVIDYLKRTPLEERKRRFHIGEFDEIDDFPMLWTWFEEDAILQKLGHPRLHSDEEGYFYYPYLWDVLIERICLEYSKQQRDAPDYHDEKSTIIEFSRGSQHGGFKRAFDHLSQEVIGKLAVLYINVSWEESLRKNRARFNPDKPDSILEHGLADKKLEVMYKASDWEEISAASPTHLNIQGTQVPYAVFENEDDLTTRRGEALGQRLEETLDRLWDLYTK